MGKDEFNVIESILFTFPELCRSADLLRDYRLTLACTKNPGDHVQGGPAINTGERYIEGNRRLHSMETIIGQISDTLQRLRTEEKEFISTYYFKGMGEYYWDEPPSNIYRKRKKLCQKLISIIRVYPIVREWREHEKEERLEAVKRGIKIEKKN